MNSKMPTQETESLSLPVIGMTCAACQHHVEEALLETSGVKSAHVDLMANRASVVFDPEEASAERLVAAIRAAGYDAVLPHQGVSAEQSPDPARDHTAAKAITTVIAGVLAMLLAMPLGPQMGPIDHLLMKAVPQLYAAPPDLLRWTLLVVTAVDRKSTRLNSSHVEISYAVFCLKKKKNTILTSHLLKTKHKKNKT